MSLNEFDTKGEPPKSRPTWSTSATPTRTFDVFSRIFLLLSAGSNLHMVVLFGTAKRHRTKQKNHEACTFDVISLCAGRCGDRDCTLLFSSQIDRAQGYRKHSSRLWKPLYLANGCACLSSTRFSRRACHQSWDFPPTVHRLSTTPFGIGGVLDRHDGSSLSRGVSLWIHRVTTNCTQQDTLPRHGTVRDSLLYGRSHRRPQVLQGDQTHPEGRHGAGGTYSIRCYVAV